MLKAVRLLRYGTTIVTLAILFAHSKTASAQSSGSGSSGSSSSTRSTTSSSSGSSSGTSGTGATSSFTSTPLDRATTTQTNQVDTTGFVGGSTTQNFVGGARTATQTQGQNRQFQAFQPSETSQSSQSQQTGTPRQVRSALRVGFSFPAATTAQQAGLLAATNSVSLSQFAVNRPELSGISVSLTNTGEAVLTGNVASTEASRLAANLVRLQPGVRRVKNELGVQN